MSKRVSGPAGNYRRCPVCEAPIVDPFPPAWNIELIKEGPSTGPVRSFITPHLGDCVAPPASPDPGIAVRLPGTTVASLHIGLPAPALAPVEPAAHDWTGWTEIGSTVGDGLSVWAADDIAAGQLVQFAGPGRLFVKPAVLYHVDGDSRQDDT